MEGEAGYGIALGVKSLLGHVVGKLEFELTIISLQCLHNLLLYVGGGANSIVLSTGSLSSMLLAATDLDYQRVSGYTTVYYRQSAVDNV